MGYGINQDGGCNTGLGLGLISGSSCHENGCSDQQQKKKRINLKYDDDDDDDGIFPSLTLGLIPTHQELGSELPVSSSPISTAVSNSFSNSSVKKERDHFDQLEAVENEDEEGSPRKKLRLTKQQSAILEDNFKEHTTLNPKQKQALAEQLNLRPRQVEVWFQNRRARTKLKQTEVDCEVLKKCCERLTEENKKLQREVQELKSMNMAAPVYMHLPAATLSVCPSCDRIGAAAAATGDGSAATTLTVGTVPKPHFYSPFTHPSAAC